MSMPDSRGLVLIGLIVLTPVVAGAQAPCPPEVQAAKDMLKATPRTASAAPKAPAGARGQDVKAPRAGQEKAPSSATATKGRGTTLATAERLIREADAACIAKEDARAAANAKAAMELLKYLQQP